MTHVVFLHGVRWWRGFHLTYVPARCADITQPHACVMLPAHLQPSLIAAYVNVLHPHDAWILLHQVGHALCVLPVAKVP